MSSAAVTVDGSVVGCTGPGLAGLVGGAEDDSEADADVLADLAPRPHGKDH